MANIKSAIKRVAVSEKQNLRNRMAKSQLKTALRRYDDAIKNGDENVEALYKNAVSTVDKAAAKGVIHKNAADHKKAQLAKKQSVSE
ncbi:MAG: 30S ribosomal protein S20 [Lachnospiraceae bacterium]|nr:30S ribosomal protein S20 [Lachnospiraceae bacterium]